MNKLKPWLLLALVFAAGFAGGMVATRGVVRHLVQQAIHNPAKIRRAIEARLDVKLRLDAAQRAKVDAILLDTQGQLQGLRSEFQPRFGAIVQHAKTEITATLTPEQRQKFEKLQSENRQWWLAP
jgi:hypothetical protein